MDQMGAMEGDGMMEQERNMEEEQDIVGQGIAQLDYIECGEFLIPNLTMKKVDGYIGKYGMMRKRFLQEHRSSQFQGMVLMDEMNEHLVEIERQAEERMDMLEKQMKEAEDVTEELKSRDQMEWVRKMNSIHNRAEEIVLNEIIYV